MANTLNKLKTFIKSNLNLTIIFDYMIGLTGINFEKEYEIIKFSRKKNPIILDIGAHKGESIKNFLIHKPNAIIYAFEPNKSLANKLKEKFIKHKNIKVFNSAISNNKNLKLFTPYIRGYPFSGLSSVDKKNIIERLDNYYNFKYENELSFKAQTISTIGIDKLFLKPDFIKIDAEGYEFEILKTALNTIRKYKPTIIIEFNNHSYEKLNALLTKNNYVGAIFKSEGNGALENIDKQKIQAIKRETNLINLVYVSKSSALYSKIN
jgi:FkbM family methyltransferase